MFHLQIIYYDDWGQIRCNDLMYPKNFISNIQDMKTDEYLPFQIFINTPIMELASSLSFETFSECLQYLRLCYVLFQFLSKIHPS